mgnify:CR=1 FL=1
MAFHNRKYEMGLATSSFVVAVVLAFLGMALHPEHDIAAGVCMVIAQFLILTASIIGIDYKLNQFGSTRPKGAQEQSIIE